ncbi:MAG: hypothetical protein ACOYJ2_01965 [Rickettsiales bacterium]
MSAASETAKLAEMVGDLTRQLNELHAAKTLDAASKAAGDTIRSAEAIKDAAVANAALANSATGLFERLHTAIRGSNFDDAAKVLEDVRTLVQANKLTGVNVPDNIAGILTAVEKTADDFIKSIPKELDALTLNSKFADLGSRLKLSTMSVDSLNIFVCNLSDTVAKIHKNKPVDANLQELANAKADLAALAARLDKIEVVGGDRGPALQSIGELSQTIETRVADAIAAKTAILVKKLRSPDEIKLEGLQKLLTEARARKAEMVAVGGDTHLLRTVDLEIARLGRSIKAQEGKIEKFVGPELATVKAAGKDLRKLKAEIEKAGYEGPPALETLLDDIPTMAANAATRVERALSSARTASSAAR